MDMDAGFGYFLKYACHDISIIIFRLVFWEFCSVLATMVAVYTCSPCCHSTGDSQKQVAIKI